MTRTGRHTGRYRSQGSSMMKGAGEYHISIIVYESEAKMEEHIRLPELVRRYQLRFQPAVVAEQRRYLEELWRRCAWGKPNYRLSPTERMARLEWYEEIEEAMQ